MKQNSFKIVEFEPSAQFYFIVFCLLVLLIISLIYKFRNE